MNNPPNVILLIWDAVRARNTSLHWYGRNTTPFLDSLVEEDAVWYLQARATSSWTLPSHTSMATGLYPQEHQANSKTLQFGLNQRHIATRLGEQGYQTGLFTNNTYLRADEFGFADAFDTVTSDLLGSTDATGIVDPEIHAKAHGHGAYLPFIKQSLRSSSPIRSLSNGVLHKLTNAYPSLNDLISEPDTTEDWETDDGAASCVDSLFEWIGDDDSPFFAFFNLLEAHAPYRPQSGYRQYVQNDDFKQLPQTPPWEYYADQHPPEYLDDLQDLYDGCLHYVDEITNELLTRLDERDLYDDTIVVIAGDHGEGFGEPGVCRPRCIGHAGGIEEELLHVPLVIKYSDQQFGGDSVSEVVSLKDLYATLLTDCLDAPAELSDHAETLHPDTPFAGRALAQRNGITQAMLDSVDEFGLDRDHFDQHLVSYYETGTDSSVVKYAFSLQSDCNVCETVSPAGRTAPLDSEQCAELKASGRAFFDGLEPVENRSTRSVEITTETQDRLEDLGYM